MQAQEAPNDLVDRMAKYYAWKLVLGQIERIFLPDARQAEADFQRWYGVEAAAGGFAPNLVIAVARSRRARLERHLHDLRLRFIAMFGPARLPSA